MHRWSPLNDRQRALLGRLDADETLDAQELSDRRSAGPGVPGLRTAIAEHQQRFCSLTFDPDREVLATEGAIGGHRGHDAGTA